MEHNVRILTRHALRISRYGVCLTLATLAGVVCPPPSSAAIGFATDAGSTVSSAAADETLFGQPPREAVGLPEQPPAAPSHLHLSLEAGRTVPATAEDASPPKAAPPGGRGSIAVVYPDIGEPYREVFTKIIEGIEQGAKSKVLSHAVGSDEKAADLTTTLKASDVRVVVALGRQGLQAADGLAGEFGIVVGGVVSLPEASVQGKQVISLSPDPALLLAKLQELEPAVQRVYLVYDPDQSGWLVRLAKAASQALGLVLDAREARDVREAVRRYQEILAAADPEHDALWLPQDPTTVEESAVLPLVLRESWERRLAVFSSNFGHVKRGALFSLYPDNVALGRSLGESAQAILAGTATGGGILPLRDVQTALNLRTAKHLGLNLSPQAQRGFDLVFSGQQ